jgi:hypothetical protein
MSSILLKGVIRNGRVEVAEPINLPDGSEVIITSQIDGDRAMNQIEIAEAFAAMAKVEPLDMTEEEHAKANDWEKKVNAYTITNMDKCIEDAFP